MDTKRQTDIPRQKIHTQQTFSLNRKYRQKDSEKTDKYTIDRYLREPVPPYTQPYKQNR